MPNIKPISDLRNYTAVISEVAYGKRVYLTRNGHGQCAIIDMKELDELDKQKALYQLMSKLNEAEISIREEEPFRQMSQKQNWGQQIEES